MVHYPHFAMPNLYLRDGFTQFGEGDEAEFQYEDEVGLEQCIRRILIRKQARLTGWDLRFLRRGMNLTQQEFGRRIGRDSQTIARWEKQGAPLDEANELLVRTVAASKLDPTLTVGELVYTFDRVPDSNILGKVVLYRQGGRWLYAMNPAVATSSNIWEGDFFTPPMTTGQVMIGRPIPARSESVANLPGEFVQVYIGETNPSLDYFRTSKTVQQVEIEAVGEFAREAAQQRISISGISQGTGDGNARLH